MNPKMKQLTSVFISQSLLATTSKSFHNLLPRKTVNNSSSYTPEQWVFELKISLPVTLSTDIKLAIFQLVAILFGMRLGAFFLAWLCANHLDKAPPMGVLCSLTIEDGFPALHTYQTLIPTNLRWYFPHYLIPPCLLD